MLLGTGWFYYLTLIAQLALLGVARSPTGSPTTPGARRRYYVLTQASIVLGLWDRLRTARWAAGRRRPEPDDLGGEPADA